MGVQLFSSSSEAMSINATMKLHLSFIYFNASAGGHVPLLPTRHIQNAAVLLEHKSL